MRNVTSVDHRLSPMLTRKSQEHGQLGTGATQSSSVRVRPLPTFGHSALPPSERPEYFGTRQKSNSTYSATKLPLGHVGAKGSNRSVSGHRPDRCSHRRPGASVLPPAIIAGADRADAGGVRYMLTYASSFWLSTWTQQSTICMLRFKFRTPPPFLEWSVQRP